jgi:putative endonuclease
MLKSDPSTWSDPRHVEGVRAEELAAGLLRRDGYRILEHRFRLGHHDVDLVARRGSIVVFVEVKARSGRRFGHGTEAVTARKQRDLARAASAWLQRHGRREDVARFDVVTVDGARVEWLQNAFRPGWR